MGSSADLGLRRRSASDGDDDGEGGFRPVNVIRHAHAEKGGKRPSPSQVSPLVLLPFEGELAG